MEGHLRMSRKERDRKSVFDKCNISPYRDAREVAGSDQNFIYGGFQAKNREFIDAVKTGTLPGSHFGDAVKTMEVAEIILAQDLLRNVR